MSWDPFGLAGLWPAIRSSVGAKDGSTQYYT